MVATHDLRGALDAILRGLTEGPHAVMQACCYIHTTARECPHCLEHGPTGVYFSPADPPALHYGAGAGVVVEEIERDYHVLPMGSLLFGEVAASREPLLLNGLKDNPRVTVPEWREIVRRFSFEGIAIYPMVCGDEVLGIASA